MTKIKRYKTIIYHDINEKINDRFELLSKALEKLRNTDK